MKRVNKKNNLQSFATLSNELNSTGKCCKHYNKMSIGYFESMSLIK